MAFHPNIQFDGFGISHCLSKGYLFGIFAITSYRRWLVTLILIIDLFILQLFFRFYSLKFRKNRLIDSASVFIIAGFLGNSVDAIVFGHVRDFIILPFIIATNFADVFLGVGLILLLIEFWLNLDFRKILFKLKPINQELELVHLLFRVIKEDFNKLVRKT